jgi:2-iminobutanoate/2-iminopropanoate deaminase
MTVPNNAAVVVGDLVFVGGVGPLDDSGALAAPDDAGAQTRATIRRLERILARAGSDLSQLAFVTVYLADATHYDAMNAAYASAMPQPYPARKCVITSMFNSGRLVELTAVASRAGRQVITL